MQIENNVIKADVGKVFRRKSDGLIFGEEIALGYTYYIGGNLLDEPLLELPEHYEEIDKPILDNDNPIIGLLSDIVAEIPTVMEDIAEKEVLEENLEQEDPILEEKKVIYVDDLISLFDNVSDLQKQIAKVIDILTPEQMNDLNLNNE